MNYLRPNENQLGFSDDKKMIVHGKLLTIFCISVLYTYNTNTEVIKLMKFDTTIPIYLQIMNCIKKDIVTGTLPPGERMDSVRTLAEKFEVNLNTMQRAASELEREEVITTQRGIGSFITGDEKTIAALKEEMSTKLVERFIGEMKGIGYRKDEILEIIRKALEK